MTDAPRFLCRHLHPGRLGLLFLAGLLLTLPSKAQDQAPVFDLALIVDGPAPRQQPFGQFFRTEIEALVEGEFELRFTTLGGDHDRSSILSAIDRAYDDPE